TFRAPDGETYASTSLTDELLRAVDCVVIVTNHAAVDYARIVARTAAIVDTRNQTRGIAADEGSATITRL
ncbi:MAG: hypothetical protein M3Y58_15575, partial [Chloroflexota bacterium]|nr:hypothetical protein [Chloroflexota bacterium]